MAGKIEQPVSLQYALRSARSRMSNDLRLIELGGDKCKPRMIHGRGGVFVNDSTNSERIDPDDLRK